MLCCETQTVTVHKILLTLPGYSSKQILRSKLLFAITNVTTMETDFQTNSAEISEAKHKLLQYIKLFYIEIQLTETSQ